MMTTVIKYAIGFGGTLFFVWLFNAIRHGSLSQDRAMSANAYAATLRAVALEAVLIYLVAIIVLKIAQHVITG